MILFSLKPCLDNSKENLTSKTLQSLAVGILKNKQKSNPIYKSHIVFVVPI